MLIFLLTIIEAIRNTGLTCPSTPAEGGGDFDSICQAVGPQGGSLDHQPLQYLSLVIFFLLLPVGAYNYFPWHPYLKLVIHLNPFNE